MNETIFNFYTVLQKHFRCGYWFLLQSGILCYTWCAFIYLFSMIIKKGVRDLFVVGATAVSAYIIAYVFKDAFNTLRPFDALSWVKPLVSESGPAFPSGHATFFMAPATALWFYHKRLAVFFGISAVLIGFARVASGIHWPIDILGGLFLGYVVGTTLHKLIVSMTDRV